MKLESQTMYRDLNLRIPEALFFQLEKQAEGQGVSLEAFCFSLLSGEKQEASLVDPGYYQSLNLDVLRREIRKVIESDLAKEEVRKRVNALEFQISRRYIR
jgi:hypothetical protein